jgi:hypothetical protein
MDTFGVHDVDFYALHNRNILVKCMQLQLAVRFSIKERLICLDFWINLLINNFGMSHSTSLSLT